MKRIVRSSITAASSNDAILTSATGLFSLFENNGVGINNTPWTGYRVSCSGLADKHVVEVKLDQIAQGDFDGNPVTYLPRFCYVGHGMRSPIDTGADTEEYIKVLQEALDFKKEIDSYFYDKLAIPRYKVL